jgi:tRNA A37 threonylcarbamoyladenosine biosynthesis protein TsaE
MARLNMDESFSQAISLVEWAERLQQAKPADRLDLSISILSEVG